MVWYNTVYHKRSCQSKYENGKEIEAMAKGKQSAAQRREKQRQQRQNRLEGAKARAATATRQAAPSRNQRKRVRRGWNQKYMVGIVVVLIVAIIIVFVVISNLQSNQSAQAPTANATPTSSQVFNAVTRVNPSVLDTVDTGGVHSPFQLIKNSGSTAPSPLVGPTGKPEFLYIGAEYCPFCAAQRWAMVVALSRFGTFSQLYETTSSSTDVYPNTPTFTFYSSLYKKPLYTSQYIDFVAVETLGNVQNADGSYPTLQKLTSEQQQLFNTYDAPPYTTQAGSIPFIDVANKFVAIGLGSGFSTQDLSGMSWSDIANSLSSGGSTASQHILGTANYMTAVICLATNQQPASVCSSSTIQKLESTVSKGITLHNGSQGTQLALAGPADVAARRDQY
jgi:hypothetical protein